MCVCVCAQWLLSLHWILLLLLDYLFVLLGSFGYNDNTDNDEWRWQKTTITKIFFVIVVLSSFFSPPILPLSIFIFILLEDIAMPSCPKCWSSVAHCSFLSFSVFFFFHGKKRHKNKIEMEWREKSGTKKIKRNTFRLNDRMKMWNLVSCILYKCEFSIRTHTHTQATSLIWQHFIRIERNPLRVLQAHIKNYEIWDKFP